MGLAREEDRSVAPHAGAWIETSNGLPVTRAIGSRLTQARGLKQVFDAAVNHGWGSRLTQARGLKQFNGNASGQVKIVAPHAGAWIETCAFFTHPAVVSVAPHAGAWIETSREGANGFSYQVAPHAGAWIETVSAVIAQHDQTVAPHAGAWIETVNCYRLGR